MRDMLDREELLPVEKALKLLLNYTPFNESFALLNNVKEDPEKEG